MNSNKPLLAYLCILGILQSFGAAAQAPAGSSSASSAASSSSSSQSELTPQERGWIKQGYTLKLSKGEKVFCHMETEIGSHFEHSACYTSDQLASRANSAQDALDRSRGVRAGGGH